MAFNPLFAAGPLLSSILGGQQTAPPAPAPMLGGTGGVHSDVLSRLAMENNFGGGMIGGLPSAMQGTKKPETVINENPDVKQPEGKFDKFFGNLDSTLSSPSKTLMIGGLGQLDPRLALAGLLASGFINGR